MKKPFEQLGAKNQDKILLKLWAKFVKLRAFNKCERCGFTNRLVAHHIYAKGKPQYYHLRWDADNGMCLCSKHHYGHKDSIHTASPANMEGWNEWMIEKWGLPWFEHLKGKALQDKIKQDKTRIKENLEKCIEEQEKILERGE